MTIEAVWPDKELESTMILSAKLILSDHYLTRSDMHKMADTLLSLLACTRVLQAEVGRLKRYEQAMSVMAAQFLCPMTTAEQLCDEILS
jgi:hypothetical protein